MPEKVAEITVGADGFRAELEDLDARLERLREKAEGIRIGGGGSGGVDLGSVGGDATSARLDRLLSVMERFVEGGGAGGGGRRPKSSWTDESIADFARENRGGDDVATAMRRRTAGRPGLVAAKDVVEGALAGAQEGNWASMLAGGASMIPGPVGQIAQIGSAVLNKILEGGKAFEAHVAGMIPLYAQAAQNQLGRAVSAGEAYRMGRGAEEYGVANAETQRAYAAEMRASGLSQRYGQEGAELARMGLLGVSPEVFGAYRGGARQYGGFQGTESGARDMVGLAFAAGLSPDKLLALVAESRQRVSASGGSVDDVRLSDFLQRGYGTNAGARSGVAVAQAVTRLGESGIGGGDEIGAPLSDVGNALLQAEAYQRARRSGKTGLAFVGQAAQERRDMDGEDVAQLLARRLGRDNAGAVIAQMGGVRADVGEALAGVAGNMSARRADTRTDQVLAERMRSEGMAQARALARSQGITVAGGLGDAAVFEQLTAATRSLGEATRSLAGAAAWIRSKVPL